MPQSGKPPLWRPVNWAHVWTTVVLLGLAVSIEPTRIGLIALLLTKQHPMRHLATFVAAGLTISMGVGLAVLFVFHHGFLGQARLDPAWVQIGIGVVALLLAAVLASNIPLGRIRKPAGGSGDTLETADPTRLKKLSARTKTFVRGESRILSGSIGAALAMPSFDYMALLALIIASGKSPLEQVAALLTFLLLASVAAIVPLFSFLVAPAATRRGVARFNDWIRSRTRWHAAVFVAILGVVLLAVGLAHL